MHSLYIVFASKACGLSGKGVSSGVTIKGGTTVHVEHTYSVYSVSVLERSRHTLKDG